MRCIILQSILLTLLLIRTCSQSTEICSGHGVKNDKGDCDCFTNYKGLNCEQLICNGHGMQKGSGCVCDDYWTGKKCNEIVCEHGEPIEKNTKCKCVNERLNQRHCVGCLDGSFDPPDCLSNFETPPDESNETIGWPDWLIWLLSGLGTIGVIIIAGLVAYAIRDYLQRKHPPTPHSSRNPAGEDEDKELSVEERVEGVVRQMEETHADEQPLLRSDRGDNENNQTGTTSLDGDTLQTN